VRRRRGAGHIIVFTNGCFDVLHLGHVRLLRQAATLGDFLMSGSIPMRASGVSRVRGGRSTRRSPAPRSSVSSNRWTPSRYSTRRRHSS
jgi:bifunctional ADP-heptose synthase (sugar kinase/adenylyltransferase)